MTDPLPGERFDLILCRNVLIYFDAADRRAGGAHAGERARARAGCCCSARPTGSAGCRPPRGAARACERPRGERPSRAARSGRARFGATPRWRAATRAADEAAPRRRPRPPTATTPLAAALAAADAGRLDDAIAATERALAADPLDADAHFIRGVAQLGSGDAAAAAASLRRALYVDPGFALAAFQLGRAYDLLGDEPAARRAYLQALRTLAPDHERQRRLVGGRRPRRRRRGLRRAPGGAVAGVVGRGLPSPLRCRACRSPPR